MVTHSVDAKRSGGSELVQEFVRSAGQTLRVDAARGVLRGVKLLGLRSRNGRRYEESALKRSVGLYEGSKVNVNHPERDPLSPRDYRDRLGVVRNVRMEAGDGLFGDLHFNPSHPLAEQLAWDAEHAPENVGLSHNVLARTRRESDGVVVEAITRVQSVDLVADPATTSGLFEQREPDEAETLRRDVAELREQLERAQDRADRETRRRRIEELLRERAVYGPLAEAVLDEAFVRDLVAAPEEELATRIDDRVRRVHDQSESRRPRSREQTVGGGASDRCEDAGAFVEAVTRR